MSQRPLHVEDDSDDSITLLVRDREIKLSRKMLMFHSDYFHVMFSRNYRESNQKIITLEGIDERAMEDLMQVLMDISYYKKIKDISEVILLSDMFLFDNIRNKLIEETLDSLSLSNCLQIWMKLELISIIPLVWKAKSMSLTNFYQLRKFGFLNALVLSELVTYLGHINLQCEREIDVFYTVLEWICSNDQSNDSLQEILGSVINYNDISVSELGEMKCCDEVMKYPDVVEILEVLIRLKCGKNVLQENKHSEIARSWIRSQERYLPNYLCVLNYEQGIDIFCHGFYENGYLNKLASVPDELSKIVGFEIQVYKMKIYIFGGEFTIGKGIWNEIFWQYNFETYKLENTNFGIPIKRRHFKSCVAADFLYIIGGTGTYRVRKNDMFYFNFKSEKWVEDIVPLPCCQTSLKFCNFNDELFILDCHERKGYIFVINENKWLSVKISESVIFDEFSSFSIFSYRGNLFFKGKKLVELQYIDDILKPMNMYDIPNYTNEALIETKISHNRVYSAYADHISGDVSLEFLNLDNLKSLFFEKVGLMNINQPLQTISQLKYKPNSTMKMFMFHHHKLVFSEDILVGD